MLVPHLCKRVGSCEEAGSRANVLLSRLCGGGTEWKEMFRPQAAPKCVSVEVSDHEDTESIRQRDAHSLVQLDVPAQSIVSM